MNTLLSSLLITVFAFGISLPAHAQVDAGVGVEARANVNTDANRQNGNASGQAATESSAEESATVTDESSSPATPGKRMAEEHRSSVASFVQSLLQVADRDGGIGAEVRAVAHSQGEMASTTSEAVAKVENRGMLMNFLFGTDWKNVGVVRSAIATNEADMKRLETALTKATNTSVQAELEVQIEALKQQQEELEAFVAEHESSFSLFGWFTKLFVSAEA